jgi:hypothetical protein
VFAKSSQALTAAIARREPAGALPLRAGPRRASLLLPYNNTQSGLRPAFSTCADGNWDSMLTATRLAREVGAMQP